MTKVLDNSGSAELKEILDYAAKPVSDSAVTSSCA